MADVKQIGVLILFCDQGHILDHVRNRVNGALVSIASHTTLFGDCATPFDVSWPITVKKPRHTADGVIVATRGLHALTRTYGCKFQGT